MANNNQLSDFTAYIDTLCRKHVEILHTDDDKHFVELNDEQQLGDSKVLCYPLVTIDKLTVSYTGGEDFMNKNRYVEMMFLESISNSKDYAQIQITKNKMEHISEDFLRKIKRDKRDRKKYPFLKNLSLSDIEMNFVENSSLNIYGTLLSFNFELAFVEEMEDGRFTEDSES